MLKMKMLTENIFTEFEIPASKFVLNLKALELSIREFTGLGYGFIYLRWTMLCSKQMNAKTGIVWNANNEVQTCMTSTYLQIMPCFL